MFYLYFFLQYLGILLLSPIRWSLNFAVRFLWTGFTFNISNLKHSPKTNLSDFAEQTKERLISNIDKIIYAGDSAKFVSILLVATDSDKVCQAFKSYIKDGKFYRKPGIITRKNFSGDMFAGYSYALLHLLYRRKIDEDAEFKEELIKAFQSAIFEKPYLQFKSYSETSDRGYLLRWFFANAGHFLPLLTLLQLQYRLTKEKKYLALYYIVFPIAFVDILVNPTFTVRIKNYRYMQWYYVHSNFLYYYTLYKLTSNPVYKYAMKFIHERFWFNPEFAAIMGAIDIHELHLFDYTYQSEAENKKANVQFRKRKVKNIKDILRRRPAEYEEFEEILPPRARKNDYQWEKAMDWNEWKETELSGIDFLHVYHLLEKKGWK